MRRECEAWVRSCVNCAMKKNPRQTNHVPLLSTPIESAFERVVNCLGPFPTTHSGNKYIVRLL